MVDIPGEGDKRDPMPGAMAKKRTELKAPSAEASKPVFKVEGDKKNKPGVESGIVDYKYKTK